MSSVNLGRVQGAGVFYSSAASGTSVELSTVTPTSVKPLSGDTIVFSNGDLRTVTGISGTTITCGSVIANIKGPKGDTSDPEYTGTFELPGFQSSANDIIMDSITFTSTTNTFTSVGVTPVVGLPVSGTYRRTTNNRFYKWVGTITSISGSTVTITATQGGFTSQSYQHNIFIRSTDNFNNICFSFIHTNSIALTTISAISRLLLGEGFNSAYRLVPATGSQRISISPGEYAAANAIGVWANSTGSNLLVKRSYINNGSYVIEGTALSTSESFEINDIVIEL